jgi:hypothetical protein
MKEDLKKYLPDQADVNDFTPKERAFAVNKIMENRSHSNVEQQFLVIWLTEMCVKAEQNKRVELDKTQDSEWHWAGMFEPKEKQTYFTVEESAGGLAVDNKCNTYQQCTDAHRALGVCCKTEKEAEFIRSKQVAYLEVVDLLKKLNNGWRPDWTDEDQEKYFLFWDHSDGEILCDIHGYSQGQRSELAAKTEEICHDVIKQLGPDKIYLALWEDFHE